MTINITSVFVDDQTKALDFYTTILGCVKKLDFPMGQFKWLTVVSLEESSGIQLLLEPNDNPAAKIYQGAIYEQGIRAISLFISDIQKEYERMKRARVRFTMEPTKAPASTIAVFDDTCANLVQLTQVNGNMK